LNHPRLGHSPLLTNEDEGKVLQGEEPHAEVAAVVVYLETEHL